jgi:hypothetical protein
MRYCSPDFYQCLAISHPLFGAQQLNSDYWHHFDCQIPLFSF